MKMLDKYPYFLDKREVSNLYKVTDVNNSIFQDLYNNLFQTYQSFHLNKKVLIWKTQYEPYVYQTHFRCGYPNLKSVKVYKNDILIHKRSYSEDDKASNFSWDYVCSYVRTNFVPTKVYKCLHCDELHGTDESHPQSVYIGNGVPEVCENCGVEDTYALVQMYQCVDCGEIYLVNEDVDGSLAVCDCGSNKYREVYAYECRNKLPVSEQDSETEAETCGNIYIGAEPPEVCEECGGGELEPTEELYYNDDLISIVDNATYYEDTEELSVEDDDVVIRVNNRTLYQLIVRVTDNAVNLLDNVKVVLWKDDHTGETKYTVNGIVEFTINPDDTYVQLDVHKEGYVSLYNEEDISYDLNFDFYQNPNITMDVTLYDANVWSVLNEYDELEDYTLREQEYFNEKDSGEQLQIPFPVIPDDVFKMEVETWDEYTYVKGFPENDTYEGNEFDHDSSLDEIGALNNIPRKQYIAVEDKNLYASTEPPYNKQLSEDDYHYMKRMIQYNLRMWATLKFLEEKDSDYQNYLDLLMDMDIANESDYQIYKENSRLWKEHFNPVTLEVWKNYGIASSLVNREKKLLKLFDVRKHNKSYVPYKVDDEGNPVKVYNNDELDDEGNPLPLARGKIIYKDNWDVLEDPVECWQPLAWEHKDKFCDGSKLYTDYLFVRPETLRPLPYENVGCKFYFMNSIAEIVEKDYYVLLEYYRGDESEIKLVNGKKIYGGYCTLSYKMLSNIEPTTVRFTAYNSVDDTEITSTEVIFNPRNCCNADIYVDATSTSNTEDGSKAHPYKSLQTALNKVNRNMDVICLKSDIEITSPLFVPNNCAILGVRERNPKTNCELEQGVENVPIINNPTDKKFFDLIGGKNCKLKLVDVRLKHSLLNSYIGLGTWENNNKSLDNYETVIIHGGLVRLDVEFDKDEYYPSDNVKITITLTDKNGKLVPDQQLELVFDDEEPITITDEQGSGVIYYNLQTHKLLTGVYDLTISLKSDLYFNTTVQKKVNCTKEPEIYPVSSGSSVCVSTDGLREGDELLVCIDGQYASTITVDANGEAEYCYTPQWGAWAVWFVEGEDCSDDVIKMFTVETKIEMSRLYNVSLIKNFKIGDDGKMTYDRLNINSNTVMGDLNNVLIDLENYGDYVKDKTFKVDSNRVGADHILASEGMKLKEAINELIYYDNGDIKFTRIGEFWS